MIFANFILIYIVSGFVFSVITKKIFGNILRKYLIYILGYGISPFIISLLLYTVYFLLPAKNWTYYNLIVYTAIALIAFIFCKDFYSEIRTLYYSNVEVIIVRLKNLGINFYLSIILIIFVSTFIFIKGFIYPHTWVDLSSYLEQSQIYANDRSHARSITHEPLCAGNSCYKFNTSITPGLPVLGSFFLKNDTTFESLYDSNQFAIRFIYFYYFILSIFLFSYILYELKKSFATVTVGLILFLCNYGFSRFMINNFKEIILIFFSLFSLYVLKQLHVAKNKKEEICLSLALGMFMGMSIFVNFSGIIISAIILMIFLFISRKKISSIILPILIISITTIIFSGLGVYRDTSNFILNKKFISVTNTKNTTSIIEKRELVNYKIVDNNEAFLNPKEIKSDILINGKLQEFTQVYFHGIIFISFLSLLFLNIYKRQKQDIFISLITAYLILLFLAIRDPFFINPHKYAYVLSVSQKYASLFLPFAAIFIAYHYESILPLLKKIKLRHAEIVLFTLTLVLIISPIRNFISEISYNIFSFFAPLFNSSSYYKQKINAFFLIFGIISLLSLLLIMYLRKSSNENVNLKFINALLLLLFFITPYLYALNSSEKIFETIKNIGNGNIEKLESTAPRDIEKNFYKMIQYINTNIDKNKVILVIPSNDTSSTPRNHLAKKYIANSSRVIRSKDLDVKKNQTHDKIDFILTNKNALNSNYANYLQNTSIKKITGDIILLKKNGKEE